MVKHPWWVRTREKPKYEIIESEYEPYDPRKTVFGSFQEYAGEERVNSLRQRSAEKRVSGIIEEQPGMSLADRALAFGAQTIWQTEAQQVLYSWTSHRDQQLKHMRPEGYSPEITPEKGAALVKKAADFYGALMVGIAKLNRGHVYSHDYQGRPISFRDVAEPQVSEDERVIPDSCQWVIALAVRQDWDAMMGAPNSLSSAAVAYGYSTMPKIAGSLAEFIRALGYNAIPCGNDTALSVPIAIDAGLGEFGRHARLITPRYGSNVRLAKVITDMPLAPDKPIDFGVVEFCKDCMKCATHCPSQAMSFDREPSYNTLGPWNRKGVKMWQEDAVKCLEQWQRESTGCSICLRVCPYNHRDDAMHRMVMASISLTSAFNRFFAWADDVFGYGKQASAEKWWGA